MSDYPPRVSPRDDWKARAEAAERELATWKAIALRRKEEPGPDGLTDSERAIVPLVMERLEADLATETRDARARAVAAEAAHKALLDELRAERADPESRLGAIIARHETPQPEGDYCRAGFHATGAGCRCGESETPHPEGGERP